MKKSDLVKEVAIKSGVTNTVATDIVNIVFETIEEAVSKKEEVNISGFGKFEVKKREARDGVNPKTGEKIKIAASNSVKFKVSKKLKEAVN